MTSATPAIADDDIDRVLHIDPKTLAIGTNARETVVLDPEFLASVKELGVLEAIHAYRVDGVLTVERGQRRTLAAIKGKRKTVPVLVVAAPDDKNRLVNQLTENIHRSAMTTMDVTKTVEQLALLGVTENQIVKRTALPKNAVAAALRVSKSAAATAAAAEHPSLNLDQLAGLAEFEGDGAAAERLLTAARQGGFGHTLQRLRDDRAAHQARDEAAARFTAEGLTVVPAPTYGTDSKTVRVTALADVDASVHATTCPGHAVCVGQDWITVWADTEEPVDEAEAERLDDLDDDAAEFDDDGELAPPTTRERKQMRVYVPQPVCTDPVANGHRVLGYNGGSSSPKGGAMTDEEKADRRRLIENNKAWTSASAFRRDWLFAFVARKQAPAGAELFIYREMLHTPFQMHLALDAYGKGAGHQSFRDVMGLDREAASLAGSTTIRAELDELLAGADTIAPKRATLLTAAMILAAWHHLAGTNTWRSPTAADRRILGQMVTWGYELSDVEKLVLAEPGTPEPAEDVAPAAVQAEPTYSVVQTEDGARLVENPVEEPAEHPDVEAFLDEIADEGIAAADVDVEEAQQDAYTAEAEADAAAEAEQAHDADPVDDIA